MQAARYRVISAGLRLEIFLQSAHASMQDAFSKLRALDKLTVRVVVDDETDGISSPCDACKTVPSDATCCSYISEFSKALMLADGLEFDRICTAGAALLFFHLGNCSAWQPTAEHRRLYRTELSGNAQSLQGMHASLAIGVYNMCGPPNIHMHASPFIIR